MTRREKITAWLIGTGLVLSVIHQPNQPFIAFAFIPQIGNFLIIMASATYLLELKKGEIDLGSKWIWIPLAVIVLSIIARPFYALATGDTIWGMRVEWSGAAYGMALFALYLAGRKLGTEIFKPFTAGVIIASVGCIAFGIINPGVTTGGIISITNYDMATGFLVFGVVVSSWQSRWWLSAIAIVGLFFTGADEAIFACAILLLVVLVRRDWSRKLLLPIGALVLTLAICTPLGITQSLYFPTIEKTALAKEAIEDTPIAPILAKVVPQPVKELLDRVEPKQFNKEDAKAKDLLNAATGYRWFGNWDTAINNISIVGHGYNINNFYKGIPHNVPLIILHQVGIVAALAWLWVVILCLIKTKWKYAFIGVLALSVFDHFIWTQAAPWVWALIGVSSADEIKNDYIFKRR